MRARDRYERHTIVDRYTNPVIGNFLHFRTTRRATPSLLRCGRRGPREMSVALLAASPVSTVDMMMCLVRPRPDQVMGKVIFALEARAPLRRHNQVRLKSSLH